MQDKKEKELYFRTIVGRLVKKFWCENTNISCLNFANQFGLNDSHIGKIERALVDCKLITLWKILESMEIDVVEFMQMLKEELGDDFKFMDE